MFEMAVYTAERIFVLQMKKYLKCIITNFIFLFSILAIYIETVYRVPACGTENQFLAYFIIHYKSSSGSYHTCQ